MSLSLRHHLTLLVTLGTLPPAADDAAARARAALALAVAAQPDAEYARLRQRAVAEDRPLLVWVGVTRLDLERARPDCLHLRRAAFPGAAAPCVVVGRPAGGELWRAADLPAAGLTTTTLAGALAPPPAAVAAPAPRCGPGGCFYPRMIDQ